MNRDLLRNRIVDSHLPLEITPSPQRTPSRQTLFIVKIIEIIMKFIILYYLESSNATEFVAST